MNSEQQIKPEVSPSPNMEGEDVQQDQVELKICVIGNTDDATEIASRMIEHSMDILLIKDLSESEENQNENLEKFLRLDPNVIIFACETANFEAAVEAFPQEKYENKIVFTFLPVMVYPRDFLLSYLPANSGVIAGGKIVGKAWNKAVLPVDIARLPPGKLHKIGSTFLRVWYDQECKLRKYSGEEFEEEITYSLLMPSVISMLMDKYELVPTAMDTENSERLLTLTCKQEQIREDITHAQFKHSLIARKAFDRLEQCLVKVRNRLEQKNLDDQDEESVLAKGHQGPQENDAENKFSEMHIDLDAVGDA